MKRRTIAAAIGSISAVAMLTVCGVAWHMRMSESGHHASQAVPSSRNTEGADQGDLTRNVVPPSTNAFARNGAELISPSVLAGLNMGVDDSYPGDEWFHGANRGETVNPTDKNGQSPEPSDRQSGSGGESETRIRLDVPQSVQETGYWCVPAAVQMVLGYKGIDVSQSTLANEMGAKPATGTEYADLARVANKYLFGSEDANPRGSGYHVQTIAVGDTDPAVAHTFMERAKADLDDGYPVFAAVDTHTLYPTLGRANHMIVITGYDADASGVVTHWTYIDPWYRVQDETYGGLKIVTMTEMIAAIVSNEEPAYIW
ncbi:C39 family peptidase [Bifidobacterium amazonense]|uniref:C39 family peptidase n=1 Tax=Bifidobacterium amazonense TaxID=2809027 RepID=A0ABS9VU36_9BIFI|nr:C39 family peptidase [Bifidobacterium amazonense]MCH9275605.1 C39 family peptidase [Bifidobacterium amazonense]